MGLSVEVNSYFSDFWRILLGFSGVVLTDGFFIGNDLCEVFVLGGVWRCTSFYFGIFGVIIIL